MRELLKAHKMRRILRNFILLIGGLLATLLASMSFLPPTKTVVHQDYIPMMRKKVALSLEMNFNESSEVLYPTVTPSTRSNSIMPCTAPVKHVYYLRTFKTGSSTVTTLLFRKAWKENLKIVPVKRDPYPHTIEDAFINKVRDYSPDQKFDIFPEHILFNKSAVKKYMKADAKYIVSLRHPMSHFKSAFLEFLLPVRLNISDPDPPKYFLTHLDRYRTLRIKPRSLGATKSLQSFQLGLKLQDLDNMTTVDEFIKDVDKTFDLVLISEYFDESLILMRRKFCWETKDVIYLSQRIGSYKVSLYDEELLLRHQNWSAADYRLYHFFVNRLFDEIRSMPQDYWNELENFQLVNQRISEFCDDIENQLKEDTNNIYKFLGDLKSGLGRKNITVESKPWGGTFMIDAVDCAFMKLDTITARNLLILQHNRELCSERYNRTQVKVNYPLVFDGEKSVSLNIQYCRSWSPVYNLPINIFSERKAYMWKYPTVR